MKRVPQDTDRSAMVWEKLESLTITIKHRPYYLNPHWTLLFRLPSPAHLALYTSSVQLCQQHDHPFRQHYNRPSRTQRDAHIHSTVTILTVHLLRTVQSLQISITYDTSLPILRRRLVHFMSPDDGSTAIDLPTGVACHALLRLKKI